MCSGDLKLLTIKGTPGELELAVAWDKIQQEYSDLTLNERGNSGNIFEAYKRLKYTEWKLQFLLGNDGKSGALTFLKYNYDAEVAGKVLECGYDFIEDKPNREEYLKQIYAIETECKFLVVQLNQLTAEYIRIAPKTEGKANDVRRAFFEYERELAILSRFMKYRIHKNKITVAEFCAIIRTYMDYVKANKR